MLISPLQPKPRPQTKTSPPPRPIWGLWADSLNTNAGAPLWPVGRGLVPGYCSRMGVKSLKTGLLEAERLRPAADSSIEWGLSPTSLEGPNQTPLPWEKRNSESQTPKEEVSLNSMQPPGGPVPTCS